MKKAIALSVMFAVALCVVLGCGKPSAPTTPQASPPSAEDAKAFLSNQVPATVNWQSFHVLGIRRDGEVWVVQFDGVLTPYAPLFLPVNLDEELARLQWHPKKPVADASKPKLIRQFDRIATTGELWARNASGWQFEVSQWNIKELNFGQPRDQFPPEALPLGSALAQDPVFRYLQRGQFEVLELSSGATYKNVVLDAMDLDAVMVSHAKGMGSVKLAELPIGLQAFFHTDPAGVERERQARQAVDNRRNLATAEQSSIATRERSQPNRPERPRPEYPPGSIEIGEIIKPHLREYYCGKTYTRDYKGSSPLNAATITSYQGGRVGRVTTIQPSSSYSSPVSVQATAERESFRVSARSPIFDEEKWAWMVAYDCEFTVKKDRLSSGERLKGSGSVWFKGKNPVSWDYGYEPHSSFE